MPLLMEKSLSLYKIHIKKVATYLTTFSYYVHLFYYGAGVVVVVVVVTIFAISTTSSIFIPNNI